MKDPERIVECHVRLFERDWNEIKKRASAVGANAVGYLRLLVRRALAKREDIR